MNKYILKNNNKVVGSTIKNKKIKKTSLSCNNYCINKLSTVLCGYVLKFKTYGFKEWILHMNK